MIDSDKGKQLKRWIRALNLGKILFSDKGYSDKYLKEIEEELRLKHGEEIQLPLPLIYKKKKGRR